MGMAEMGLGTGRMLSEAPAAGSGGKAALGCWGGKGSRLV